MKQLIVALALALSALPAFADELNVEAGQAVQTEEAQKYDANVTEEQDLDAILNDEAAQSLDLDSWRFLGCVRTSVQCNFRAFQMHYPRWAMRMDWRHCGRWMRACYGWRSYTPRPYPHPYPHPRPRPTPTPSPTHYPH